jgi:hypothetical protein
MSLGGLPTAPVAKDGLGSLTRDVSNQKAGLGLYMYLTT